jgi:hypothetical protein
MPPDPADPSAPRREFFAQLERSLTDHTFVKLVFARPRSGPPDLQRVDARRVALRGVDHLSFVHHFTTRDTTRNLPLPEALRCAEQLAGQPFANLHLFTRAAELQLRLGKRGTAHLTVTAHQRAVPAASHDRQKARWLAADRPFLRTLGVTTPDGQVVPTMARKWRQIDQFVGVVAKALEDAGLAASAPLQLADFGAGKGYLTFAVHDWLQQQGGAPTTIAVERREDLVAAGNDAAAALGIQGLQFVQGDLASHRPERLDLLLALHACDTATDAALYLGITSGAAVVVCAPCCHRELRPQLAAGPGLADVLRHGVHEEQFAEMLTDSVRALLLEAAGYTTKVFEFVALEHTAKNKLLLGVRHQNTERAASARQRAVALLAAHGAHHQELLRLLGG